MAYDDMVKGAPVPEGHVIVESEELQVVAPGQSRLIEIVQFADGAEIDPVHQRSTYYLAPDGEESAKPYGLLRDALADAGSVGIASFVMRGQQYLAAIRVQDDAVVLETLYFADEIRSVEDELPRLPERGSSSKKERGTAVQLTESITDQWDPMAFTDTYRERVDEMVEHKRKGEEVVAEGEPPESTNVVDLMDALQRSVANAKGQRGQGHGRNGTHDQVEPSDLSKKDLEAVARELDISGRSKMTRSQLEHAVTKAQRLHKKAS